MLLLSAALALAGCSFTLPVAFTDATAVDMETTGTIAKPERPIKLASDLTDEDWRRAKNALGVALDPQGNGQAASWSNPESGAKGAFTPVGIAFVKGDEICRLFTSSYSRKDTAERHFKGEACRPSGGDWALSTIEPQKEKNG